MSKEPDFSNVVFYKVDVDENDVRKYLLLLACSLPCFKRCSKTSLCLYIFCVTCLHLPTTCRKDYIMCHAIVSCVMQSCHVSCNHVMCHAVVSCVIQSCHVSCSCVMCHAVVSCVIQSCHVSLSRVSCHVIQRFAAFL